MSPDIDTGEIATGLSETFPELAPVRIAGVLGAGFHSVAVETEAGIVFRIARTMGTAQRYLRERRLLDVLRPRLPVAVPKPRWLVESSACFPLGVSGYPKLEGRVAVRDDTSSALAGQLGAVLLALHRTPIEELGMSLARQSEQFAHYRSLHDETSPVLHSKLAAREYDRVERWWKAFLNDDRLLEYEPAPTHNDFWYGNMLVDEAGQLTGVIDWEFCDLADPAVDLATLLHSGEDFAERVVLAYRAAGGRFAEGERHRMRRLWELREFYGVQYGARVGGHEELEDALRKLRAGPAV